MASKKPQALAQKLELLAKTFKPIPFLPNKTLDFSTHETLLKRIGLWDFVHVEFECNIRTDLLAQLLVTFNPQNRCSYINGNRIDVGQADLARALRLPENKDKINVGQPAQGDEEAVSEEAIAFVEDLVSNWVVLHEDSCIFPNEVLNWTQVIKEGHPEKVDWASLIWFMVEKEVSQGSRLGHCFYASHLQCLIKSQSEAVFALEAIVDLTVKEDEEEKDAGELKASEDVGEQQQRNLDRGLVFDEEEKQEEQEHQEGGFTLLPEFNSIEAKSSTNPIDHEIEASQVASNCPLTMLMDHHLMEQQSAMDETNPVSGIPSIFSDVTAGEIDDEHDISQQPLIGNHKRVRSNESLEQNSFDFDICMENIELWMGKAKMLYEAKEQASNELNGNQELSIMMMELQQRDNAIEHLRKVRFDQEQQNRQVEFFRLEHQIFGMEKLLGEYRNTLKEARREFAEYRARCPLPDEPLDKDVAGNGGLVFEEYWTDKFESILNKIDIINSKLLDVDKKVKLLLKEICSEPKVLLAADYPSPPNE